ncbi:hypothetical protein niasHS_010915 [Heterodera schachtii]|uniref:Uncharacterized protein n=1 Tax=Heterodera schachtii TaxID=97005 RepID=A0ABD2IU31_HETSC
MHHLRCVLVGDPCVGKTALIVAYTRNGFCERYSPTAFDNYSVTVCSEFDSIRPLSYSGASVFLLCFNVTRPSSLNSATQRWLPEIRSLAPSAPILLIGTQSDRRLISHRSETVETKAMAQLSERLELSSWLECSAVTQHNLKEVFDLAILQGLCHEQKLPAARNSPSIPKAKIALPEAMKKTDKKEIGKGANGTTKGGTLKQNLWRLVSITKKALL